MTLGSGISILGIWGSLAVIASFNPTAAVAISICAIVATSTVAMFND